ncbi:MAG: hypothetical protein HZA90_20065 [Verrucomicrobia bacterium]|nr:hypothetical protein [Verrucomicrobiota bacterium]
MKQQTKPKPRRTGTKPPGAERPGIRLFSEAEREGFLSRNDYTGFDYFVAGRLREKKKQLSPKQQEMLAKHEDVEKLIRTDPQAVLTKAHQSIDDGVTMLLKLIHSGTFHHEELGWRADRAVGCFLSRLWFANEQLIRLAEIRAPDACSHLWLAAKRLASAFVRLATVYPEEFRSAAESSLTMPSLRARHPNFTCDAAAIAQAVHLAEKHPAPDICDNRSRMGALCHWLVANIVDRIESARSEREGMTQTAQYKKGFSKFFESDVIDLAALVTKLKQPKEPVSIYLSKRLSWATRQLLARYAASTSNPAPLLTALVKDLNRIVRAQSIYEPHRFSGVALRPETQRLLSQEPQGDYLVRRNRFLLEDAFPRGLARGLTKADKIIPDFYHPSVCRNYEACWELPGLRGNADAWWNGRVKELLLEEFGRMSRQTTHNPGLWLELVRATDGGTEKEKWRVLEKNCRNKLKQVAGENPSQA